RFSFRMMLLFTFFFSSRRRHTRFSRDWSSDVCSSDLLHEVLGVGVLRHNFRFHVWQLAPVVDPGAFFAIAGTEGVFHAEGRHGRSEERRVGKECRWRWAG